jgi:hypothetical protein
MRRRTAQNLFISLKVRIEAGYQISVCGEESPAPGRF